MASILVIDDTPLAVICSCRYLEKQGHQVRVTTCGKQGVAMARELRPDVILLDLIMPGVDGLQVLSELSLGDSPNHPRTPVIVVSGSDSAEDIVRCLDLGAIDFISKPVDLPVLAARVRVALKTKYSQDVLARTNQHLSVLASIDPLTQMYNRRRFLELSHRELAKAQRFARDLAVIMLDMDHFKDFNDSYGHATGDEALQLMAKVLLSCTRDIDIAGRIGGEEFAVCCPETDLEGAVQLAERIRIALSAEHFESSGKTLRVTASLGVTVLCGLDTSFDSVLKRADCMMYKAKHDGRNKVLSA